MMREITPRCTNPTCTGQPCPLNGSLHWSGFSDAWNKGVLHQDCISLRFPLSTATCGLCATALGWHHRVSGSPKTKNSSSRVHGPATRRKSPVNCGTSARSANLHPRTQRTVPCLQLVICAVTLRAPRFSRNQISNHTQQTRMLDFGQFDFGQLAEIELAEVEIGRSRNWPKSKLAEVEIGRSRKKWPKSNRWCLLCFFFLSFFFFLLLCFYFCLLFSCSHSSLSSFCFCSVSETPNPAPHF